ncbi:Uncharacterised protein [Mycobacteroides abscessus]|nr:Uncharacterised protein [Mycobacteroides abscessus]
MTTPQAPTTEDAEALIDPPAPSPTPDPPAPQQPQEPPTAPQTQTPQMPEPGTTFTMPELPGITFTVVRGASTTRVKPTPPTGLQSPAPTTTETWSSVRGSQAPKCPGLQTRASPLAARAVSGTRTRTYRHRRQLAGGTR